MFHQPIRRFARQIAAFFGSTYNRGTYDFRQQLASNDEIRRKNSWKN